MRPNYIAAIIASGALPFATLNATGYISAPQTIRTMSGTSLRVKFRVPYDVRADVSGGIVLPWAGIYLSSNVEANAPAAYSIVKLALEIGGATYPLLFSGGRTATVNPGDVDVCNDALAAAMTKGSTVYLRGIVQGTTTGYPSSVKSGMGYSCWQYDPVNEVDDVDGVGAMTAPTGGVNSYPPTPLALAGLMPASTPSYMCWGDSIGDGLNDYSPNSIDKTAGNLAGGFVRRAAYIKGAPLLCYASPGRTVQQETNGTSKLMQSLAKYSNRLIQQGGTNDLQGGASLATIQTNITTLITRYKAVAQPGAKVMQCTYPPRVITTDKGTSLANQTPINSFQAGDIKDQLVAWFSTQIGTLIDAVIDVAAPVADPTTPQKWAQDAFASTFAAAVTSSQTTGLQTAAKPAPYTTIVGDPGGASQSTGLAVISTAPSGSGPFSFNVLTALGVAQASGNAVKGTPSLDGTHPSAIPNAAMATVLAASLI